MPMPPFLRWIAAGLVLSFVGSVAALVACAYPTRQEASEFSNLRALALRTAQHVAPAARDLINLVK